MARFVLCHFMNCIMDGIQVQFFGHFGNFQFGGTCAFLGFHAGFDIGLGVPYYLAKQLSKFGSMLSLFPGIALECIGYLWITFTIGLTAHGKIHADFVTLSHEVVF